MILEAQQKGCFIVKTLADHLLCKKPPSHSLTQPLTSTFLFVLFYKDPINCRTRGVYITLDFEFFDLRCWARSASRHTSIYVAGPCEIIGSGWAELLWVIIKLSQWASFLILTTWRLVVYVLNSHDTPTPLTYNVGLLRAIFLAKTGFF